MITCSHDSDDDEPNNFDDGKNKNNGSKINRTLPSILFLLNRINNGSDSFNNFIVPAPPGSPILPNKCPGKFCDHDQYSTNVPTIPNI